MTPTTKKQYQYLIANNSIFERNILNNIKEKLNISTETMKKGCPKI